MRVPLRFRSHIWHDHLDLAARCFSAGSSFAIHRYAWKAVVIAGWKARRNCLLDCRATGIDQYDTAATSAGGLFYNSAKGFENRFQGVALGRHFQYEILAGEQGFRSFSVFDVG